MWRLMGVGATAEQVTCKVQHPVDPNRNLHFLSDFPHLLKCLRNSLLKASFNAPDDKVMIDHVRQAFQLDSDNVTLKAMPYMTPSHLAANSIKLIRVSVAFQLFGPHVLRALHLYKPRIEKVKIGDVISIMMSPFSSKALWAYSWRAKRKVLSSFSTLRIGRSRQRHKEEASSTSPPLKA
ncbi:hypothetical protein HPB47_025398 [Ixodes persulcatus]|uniref:Uncharacterized protein n=1 Tax=Ixodes persulcatus TaxID=34615 RepID=A0AC60Q3G3_IXOPE|nr:hypothetical protein HPB47_025398 [Ixodes persulcatus]